MTFHVFVVDTIMFTKRFVVSRHCIFDMNVYYVRRELALNLLGDDWYNIGSWLARCWVVVSAMLGDGWHNVG